MDKPLLCLSTFQSKGIELRCQVLDFLHMANVSSHPGSLFSSEQENNTNTYARFQNKPAVLLTKCGFRFDANDFRPCTLFPITCANRRKKQKHADFPEPGKRLVCVLLSGRRDNHNSPSNRNCQHYQADLEHAGRSGLCGAVG